MAKIKIIDVSEHNGTLNWNKIKQDGIQGLIIRVGFGFWTQDRKFLDNIRGAEKAGIPYGLYFYSYATNMGEAKIEVSNFLYTIRNLKPLLPIIVDTEDADGWRRRNGLSHFRDIAAMLKYQLTEIEKAGYYAMWYANLSWARSILNQDSSIKRYDLWLAHWNSTMGNPGMSPGIWQYSEKGPSYGYGISTCDMNVGFKDYPTIIKNTGLNNFIKAVKPLPVQKDRKVIKKKSYYELAKEVRKGLWGNWPEREKRLSRAGYSYAEVQKEVNRQIAEEDKLKVGDRVKVIGSTYATGERIPNFVKTSTHVVSEIKNNKVLLGHPNGINSWLRLADIKKVR